MADSTTHKSDSPGNRGGRRLPDPTAGRSEASPPPRNLPAQVYALLTDTTFAITVLIVLAGASILGLIVIDQIPLRGEMAREFYPGREGEPLIWMLIHLVPASPFRSVLFRALLALLSLSLLACTIKRWRQHWRRAWTMARATPGIFASPAALRWTTRAHAVAAEAGDTPHAAAEAGGSPRGPEEGSRTSPSATAPIAASVQRLLARKLFTVRIHSDAGTNEIQLSAMRFGFSGMGSVLAHVGLLLLVIGGIVMASTGSSQLVWMRPGEEAALNEGTLRLNLDDFRVETTPSGRIADYVSAVRLYEGGHLVRQADIEVNHPLRYKGHSVYQSSYRQDPARVRALDILFDLDAIEELAFKVRHGGSSEAAAGHQQLAMQLRNPMTLTVPWDSVVPLPAAPLAVAIDTFLADFRIDAQGPGLASEEFRNPAARLLAFVGDSLAGRCWYFALHPEMPVGTGLVLPVRIVDLHPVWMTGLEVSTHPGSFFVWAGIAVMTLGTLLAFLFRREQVWLRLRPQPSAGATRLAAGATEAAAREVPWEVTFVHQGAARQAPEFVHEAWQARATPLGIQLVRLLEPAAGTPVGGRQAEEGEGE